MDDCSKFVWVYFLSQKSQNFKMVKTQFSCDIKSLQSDGGGEYQNVSTFLKQHGIIHRVSCPHTQEQNGAIERRNRIIVEKGLTLLAQSYLPHVFWEHAFKTATYLHNRTITPILNYESPYQRLYQKIPDYAFLKTFGCLCYPYLRPYNSYKIDFWSKPCIFLGYSASHKGYICFDQSTSKIYISRHVVFDEDTFPYKRSLPHQNESQSPDLANSPTVLAQVQNPPTMTPINLLVPPVPPSFSHSSSIIQTPLPSPPQTPLPSPPQSPIPPVHRDWGLYELRQQ
ncbi:hypothetical protein LXL04_000725 [Taraxacum kok-saghyz]